MTVRQHVTATARARQAMDWLTKHPAVTRQEIGAARDLLNKAHNLIDDEQVWDAIFEIEGMVCRIYGGRPD